MPADDDQQALIDRWKTIAFDRPEEVDPDDERDWFDLAYGFFLALTSNPEQAMELTLRVEELGLM